MFLTENKNKISGEKIVIFAAPIANYAWILCFNIPIIAHKYGAQSAKELRKSGVNQVEYEV